MALVRQPVAAFARALASRRPVPGGGSAAALAGALGAALYAKVGRIVLARHARRRAVAGRLPAARRRRLTQLCAACDRQQWALLRLVDADARAYGQLVAAWPHHLPSPPKAGRSQNAGPLGRRQVVGWPRRPGGAVWRRAQRRALEAPLAICAGTTAVLQHTSALTAAAGRVLASDVVAGSALLLGGFAAAASMVAVNLQALGPSGQAAAIRRQVRQLRRRVAAARSHG